MIPYVELKSQFKSIESEVRQAIDAVLANSWFILGAQVRAFEEEYADYIGTSQCVGVASGTEAIQLALMAIGIQPDDEVITAANTCVPTVCGIRSSGAKPVLVDVDPGTLTLDWAALAKAVTPKTKAIVPVHLYGHPCDMDPIIEFAKSRKIDVLEDCAQAHGTLYKGRKCGSMGKAAAFSFYPSKNLGAYGDGGAVTTNDAAVAESLRMLRNYGEERRYHHTRFGINSRLDELQAAILRVKLKHLEDWNHARRERAQRYHDHLAELDVTTPVEASWAQHVYHLYVVRSPRRDALQAHLTAAGIGTFIHYPVPIHLQDAYKCLGYNRGDFPRAERACDEVLSLPMYPELSYESVDAVTSAVKRFSAA